MPPRARLSVVPERTQRRVSDLRDAVSAAQSDMAWLKPSDEALKMLAARMAEEIETAIDRAEEADEIYQQAKHAEGGTEIFTRLRRLETLCDVTEVVARVGPQLLAVLKELGGTPGSREKLTQAPGKGGKLQSLQNAAAGVQ